MSKRMKMLIMSTAVALLVLMIGTTVMSTVMLINQVKMNKLYSSFMGYVEDPAQEDDVVIGQEYVIKSTLQISDAYKSGDTSKLDDRDKETLDMATAVLKEIITDDMTDYDKEIAVYKYLTSGMRATTGILTVINDGSEDNDNPHDVLKNRTAVCVGYATTFRMFMQMLDIECMVVHSSGLGHSWDLVKLDDGCWYHTDCYMDSDSTNFRNFNMDDKTCRQSHEWNTSFFPSANGKKYNYILSVCKEIKDLYAIPKWVMEAIKNKDTAVSCTFKNKITSETEYLAKYMVEQLDSSISGTDKYYTQYQWIVNDEGEYVLCYYFSYNDDSSEFLTEKQRQKIDNKINDVLNQYDFYDWAYEG